MKDTNTSNRHIAIMTKLILVSFPRGAFAVAYMFKERGGERTINQVLQIAETLMMVVIALY